MTDDSKDVLAEGRYLRLVRRGRWEYVERINISGIVLIVALTDEGRLVLTEQHRIPVGAPVIELPAGLAGDVAGAEDEPLAVAAARELVEETGYQAARMERLVDSPTTAGAMNELVTFFLATGLTRVGPGGGDGTESITVHEIELARADDFLAGCLARGMMVDAKVYAGLYFAARRS